MTSGSAARTPPVGVFVGLTTLDVIHRSRRAPGPDEKMTADRQDLAAGGPAANAAVVFAALGGIPRLVTALGDGAAAAIARADLEAHGVEVIDLARGTTTDLGVSAIRVDALTGSRSVLSMDAGAHDLLAPENLGRVFADCEVALFDGHHPRVALTLAEAARARGIPVVIDAGRWKPVLGALVDAATTVIASADFRLADGHPPRQHGAGSSTCWAVTHGAGNIDWWTSEAAGDVAVPVVEAVDTLGAGDAFHGAFAYASVRGPESFADQLRSAADVAALRCSVVGPREWLALLGSSATSSTPAT